MAFDSVETLMPCSNGVSPSRREIEDSNAAVAKLARHNAHAYEAVHWMCTLGKFHDGHPDAEHITMKDMQDWYVSWYQEHKRFDHEDPPWETHHQVRKQPPVLDIPF